MRIFLTTESESAVRSCSFNTVKLLYKSWHVQRGLAVEFYIYFLVLLTDLDTFKLGFSVFLGKPAYCNSLLCNIVN